MNSPHRENLEKDSIDTSDCSRLGLLISQYINDHKLTFTEMTERVGISRAALTIACLKDGNPGKKNIPKLALVLNQKESELYRMIRENEMKRMYEK